MKLTLGNRETDKAECIYVVG